MLVIFETNFLQWTVLAMSILSFFVNGIHYLSERRAGPTQFLYIEKKGILGRVNIAWTVTLIVATFLSFITDTKVMGNIVLLFCMYNNIIALIFRRRASALRRSGNGSVLTSDNDQER